MRKTTRSKLLVSLVHAVLVAVIGFLAATSVSGQNFDFCNDCSGMQLNCNFPAITDNPDLTALCAEMDIIVIIDQSTSISGYEDDVRQGVLDFVSALVNTGVDMAVIEFDSSARLISDFATVENGFLTNMTGYFDGIPFNGETYAVLPGQGTNWMAAMRTALALETADLILFFTDGNPSFFTLPSGIATSCGNGLTTQTPEIVNPMLIANYLKGTDGAHMFMMGVGFADSLKINLERMSGPTQWIQGTTDFQSSDYSIGNFETLAAELRAFALEICGTEAMIDVDADRDSVCVGETVTFTIQVTNSGSLNPAQNIIVRDTFPAGFTNFQILTGSGACVGAACDPAEPANVLLWNVGNLDISESNTLVIQATVTMGGTLVFPAWVSGQNINLVSIANSIFVSAPPDVDAGPDQMICPGGSADLSAMATGGIGSYSYLWSTNAMMQDITVTPANTTNYTVTVTDALGCMNTDLVQVMVKPPLFLNLEDTSMSCSLAPFILNPGGNTDYTYQWSPTTDLDLTNPASPVATPEVSTTYMVTVSDGVCTQTDEVYIQVLPAPDVNIADSDTSCFGSPVVLNPGGATGFTYLWSPAQFLNDPNSPSPIAEVEQSTTFYVTITDQTPDQCSKVDSILVFVPPDMGLGAPNDTAYCDGPSIDLTATGMGLDYIWYSDQGVEIGTGPVITVEPQVETTYILEGTDIYGCASQTTVTLSPTFFNYTLSGDQVICEGETTVLSVTNNTSQVLTYLWSPSGSIVGANDQASVVVMPDSTTTYTVVITNATLGCEETEEIQVTVGTFDPDVLEIFIDKDTIVFGQGFVLSTNQSPDLLYFWDGPGIINPNLPVITAIPSSAGSYSYAVTVTNSQGCHLTGIISSLIVVNPPCNMEDIFIPDAFSPNGDGQNDELFVYGNFISSMELRIFNRWGEQVFSSQDQGKGWDGTYEGKELGPDVFGYYLRVECPPDKSYFTKGNITLFK